MEDKNWTFDDIDDATEIVVWGSDGDAVATVQGNLCLGISAKDRARKIAAAPELLKALQDIAEGCSFPFDPIQRAIRDRARAAITKATGATP